MKKIIKYGLIIILIFIPLSSVAGYWLALRSEPYAVTTKAISKSNEVHAAIGDMKQIKLAWFGYSISYSGPKGHASFEMDVDGTKRSSTVFVDLQRNAGEWQIERIRISN